MFLKFTIVQIIFFLLFLKYFAMADVEKPFYTAAVFEYNHIHDGNNSLEVANQNVDVFLKVINKARNYNADIIVFPEIGISTIFSNRSDISAAATFVPNPSDKINPCNLQSDDYPKYMERISCAAKSASMYVVINVHEKHPCNGDDKCPQDGVEFFNTNVVFDRSGTIISRYRKCNLFNTLVDSEITKPPTCELAKFTTDFNVTFGQFICFDILFKSPPLRYINNQKITDFVFPTYWFSELPFLTATQVQAGFSYANDVNFLASNINNPATCSAGSGIYAGKKGPLVMQNAMVYKNTLLVANVSKFIESGKRHSDVDINPIVYEFSETEIPIHKDDEEMDELYDNFEAYTTKLYDPKTFATLNETLCHNGLCCHFVINSEFSDLQKDDYYTYRIAVYRGTRLYGILRSGIEVCGLIACGNEDVKSCGRKSDEKTQHPIKYNNISITRTIDTDDLHFIPTGYTTDLNLLPVETFAYIIDDKRVELQLLSPREDLFSFAIYGRDEKYDGYFHKI